MVDGSSLAAGVVPSCTSVTGSVVTVAVTSAAVVLADDAFFFLFPLPILALVDLPVAVGLLAHWRICHQYHQTSLQLSFSLQQYSHSLASSCY